MQKHFKLLCYGCSGHDLSQPTPIDVIYDQGGKTVHCDFSKPPVADTCAASLATNAPGCTFLKDRGYGRTLVDAVLDECWGKTNGINPPNPVIVEKYSGKNGEESEVLCHFLVPVHDNCASSRINTAYVCTKSRDLHVRKSDF